MSGAHRRSRKIVDEGDVAHEDLSALSSSKSNSPPTSPRSKPTTTTTATTTASATATSVATAAPAAATTTAATVVAKSSTSGKSKKRRVKSRKEKRADASDSASDGDKSPKKARSPTRSPQTKPRSNTATMVSPRFRSLAELDGEKLERNAKQEPLNIEAVMLYGDWLWSVKKDLNKAKEQYQNAVAFSPTNAAALIRFAEVQAFGTDASNDVAAEYVEKALSAIGDRPTVADSDVLNRCGLFLEQNGKVARAEQLFRKAAKVDPSMGAALGNVARLLKLQKRNDDAERYYKKAIKVEPTNALLHANYGWFLESVRQSLDGAEKAYRRALKVEPNYVPALFNLARLKDVSRNDAQNGARLYKRVLKLQPDHCNANLGLAALSVKRGKLFLANELYKKAVSSDPNNPVAAFNYASFLESKMGSHEEAATVLRPSNDTFTEYYLRCKRHVEADQQKADEESSNDSSISSLSSWSSSSDNELQ